MNPEDTVYQRYYPICLKISGKPCVVVGGGEVARRRASALIDSGAKVTVVSQKLDPVLEYMAFQKEFQWIQRDFEPADIEGAFIVIAATDDRTVNHQISILCEKNEILCNIVDASEEGNFICPTTIDRGPLNIAISTSGLSPTLSSSIRQEIEMAYGEEYGIFLELMALLRPIVMEEYPTPQQRQQIFERMVSSRAISLLRNGMKEEAKKELDNIIRDSKNRFSSGGSLPIANQ